MGLSLDTLGAGPATKVESSQGVLYVYWPGPLTPKRYEEMASLPDEEKGMQLFDLLVSQVKRERRSEGEPTPLPQEVKDALTEDDLQLIADGLSSVLARYWTTVKDHSPTKPAQKRGDDESIYPYIARIVDEDFVEQAAHMREVVNRAMSSLGGGVSDAIKKMNLSSAKLKGTLIDFDRLKQPIVPETSRIWNDGFGEMQERLARERKEDRDRVRLTSQMTAESAQMLQQLVNAAGQFMARIAQRDIDDAKSVKTQVNIALGSLVASAILAASALYYAKASYDHDLSKDSSDDVATKVVAEREEKLIRIAEQNFQLQKRNQELFEKLTVVMEQKKASNEPSSVTRQAH